MKTLRFYWEGFMGFIVRTVLASFLFGLALALLATYITFQLEKRLVPPNIPLSRKGKLVLALALLLLVLNAFLTWRDYGERCKAVSKVVGYCGSGHNPHPASRLR